MMTETEARFLYRVVLVADGSWQVQKHHRGAWVTVSYCATEEAAERATERRVKLATQPSDKRTILRRARA